MTTDDIDDFSSVSSAVFYAKKNSPEKQKELLNLLSTPSPVESTTQVFSSQSSSNDSSQPLMIETVPSKISLEHGSYHKTKRLGYQPQQLSTFYSDIPLIEKVITSDIQPRKRIKKKIASPTRQLLTDALFDTKKRFVIKRKSQSSKKKQISRRKKKKQDKKKIQEQTIRLSQFIQEKTVKTKEIKPQQITSNVPESEADVRIPQELSLKVNDPFPFTNLVEWLIWHNNFPELAFVREAYDLEQVPSEEDVEVFWVNLRNDPEFFSSDWQMTGSSIDIESIKEQGRRPDWKPEWDIISSYTDGFSTFFEDVYQILFQNPQGLYYRYPILQFALKGLLLIELAYFDEKDMLWYSKGSPENLATRLKELDKFMSQQDDIPSYHRNLSSLLAKNEWNIGLVCFDLVIPATYLKHFSQNLLSEDEKIQVIKEGDFTQTILKKLSMIEKLDKERVKNLQKKFEVIG